MTFTFPVSHPLLHKYQCCCQLTPAAVTHRPTSPMDHPPLSPDNFQSPPFGCCYLPPNSRARCVPTLPFADSRQPPEPATRPLLSSAEGAGGWSKVSRGRQQWVTGTGKRHREGAAGSRRSGLAAAPGVMEDSGSPVDSEASGSRGPAGPKKSSMCSQWEIQICISHWTPLNFGSCRMNKQAMLHRYIQYRGRSATLVINMVMFHSQTIPNHT